MRYYVALILCVCMGVGVYAQDCQKIVQKELINRIKKYNPTDLVPYSKDGYKWALIDVKSKTRVTDYMFEYYITFNPKMIWYVNDCRVEVSSNYTFTTEKAQLFAMDYEEKAYISKATKESLGFEVNDKGEMTAYSKSYKGSDSDSWNISEPIFHNGAYYAILRKEKEEVVINQEGVEQETLRYKKMIEMEYKNQGENLIYVEDFEGKKGFVTLSGRKILYGELMNRPINDKFGYSVQAKEEREDENNIAEAGVLDLTTQTWIIAPQKEYRIYEILHTSTKEIEYQSAENRDKVQIFFIAFNKNEHFVLDKNGNPIKPKQ